MLSRSATALLQHARSHPGVTPHHRHLYQKTLLIGDMASPEPHRSTSEGGGGPPEATDTQLEDEPRQRATWTLELTASNLEGGKMHTCPFGDDNCRMGTAGDKFCGKYNCALQEVSLCQVCRPAWSPCGSSGHSPTLLWPWSGLPAVCMQVIRQQLRTCRVFGAVRGQEVEVTISMPDIHAVAVMVWKPASLDGLRPSFKTEKVTENSETLGYLGQLPDSAATTAAVTHSCCALPAGVIVKRMQGATVLKQAYGGLPSDAATAPSLVHREPRMRAAKRPRAGETIEDKGTEEQILVRLLHTQRQTDGCRAAVKVHCLLSLRRRTLLCCQDCFSAWIILTNAESPSEFMNKV